MRLIDGDAYIDELNKRLKAAYDWYDNAPSDEAKIRAEQAIATFCEASLTAKKMPTIEVSSENFEDIKSQALTCSAELLKLVALISRHNREDEP